CKLIVRLDLCGEPHNLLDNSLQVSFNGMFDVSPLDLNLDLRTLSHRSLPLRQLHSFRHQCLDDDALSHCGEPVGAFSDSFDELFSYELTESAGDSPGYPASNLGQFV